VDEPDKFYASSYRNYSLDEIIKCEKVIFHHFHRSYSNLLIAANYMNGHEFSVLTYGPMFIFPEIISQLNFLIRKLK